MQGFMPSSVLETIDSSQFSVDSKVTTNTFWVENICDMVILSISAINEHDYSDLQIYFEPLTYYFNRFESELFSHFENSQRNNG